MRTRSTLLTFWHLAPVFVAAGLCVACGDDDSSDPSASSEGGAETVSGSTGGDDDSARATVYGIGTLVTQPSGSTAYLRLVEALDLGGAQVSIDEAREFAGQSDLASFGSSVLVASGDEPVITKYDVGDDLTLIEAGRVSFTNFGIASAAFWNNRFVTEDKAYMVNGAAELIAWNPATMQIGQTVTLPTLEDRPGLNTVAGLADRSSVGHDGKYYLPLYWTDEDYAQRSDDSVIVVVDIATDTVEATMTAPCPGLDYVTVDDTGRIHFSNWTGGVGTYFVLGTAQNCIATLDPGTGEITTRTFASITGGREGAALRYADNGRFVMSVFDDVRADAANAEEPFGIVGGLNWQLWSWDSQTGEAGPIEQVDWNSGAIIHTTLGDAMYSMVPGADYGSTVVYALDDQSNATAAFGITGWSFRLFEVG